MLFFHQVRIVKEMREHDREQNGRPDQLCRPRFMVWENVPGAFSSNERKDFQAVLTEIVRIAEPDAPDVPMPEKGNRWPKSGCLYDELGGWSIAWRVHDAQFWGVPQRRERISLVADFGGLAAPEVLFERKGLSWHSQQGKAEGQKTSGDTGDSTYPAVANTLTRRYDGSPNSDKKQGANIVVAGFKGGQGMAGSIGYQEEMSPTLEANSSAVEPTIVCYGISGFNSEGMKSANPNVGIYEADTARTLDLNGGNPACNQGGMMIVQTQVFDARGNGNGDTVPTLTGDHESRVTDYTALAVGNGQLNQITMEPVSNTLDTMHDQQAIIYQPEIGHALHAKAACMFREDAETYVQNASDLKVRRLTPLECERLQGYPDNWTDIGDWLDSKGRTRKGADGPRYTALGNSIALPFWFVLMRRISALYERPATLGSLFDGIGGFPLVWERCNGKGTAIWASEIEDFCIAVTKKHFPEEST